MKLSPEYVLELSAEAYDDLVNIQNYTFSKYGEGQWQEYGSDLDKGMLQLLKHPFSSCQRQLNSDPLFW